MDEDYDTDDGQEVFTEDDEMLLSLLQDLSGITAINIFSYWQTMWPRKSGISPSRCSPRKYGMVLVTSNMHIPEQKVSSVGTMWGRCKKLESNLTFGSEFSQRQKVSGHLNSFACFQQEVDINVRYQRRDVHLVPVDYYGDIKYFFLHNFEDVDHLLVYVGWVHQLKKEQ